MGREWNEEPSASEPWRPSPLYSLPRLSIAMAGVREGWAALLLLPPAPAACSCVVRLEVCVGGDARGVAMSMGDAAEDIAPEGANAEL